MRDPDAFDYYFGVEWMDREFEVLVSLGCPEIVADIATGWESMAKREEEIEGEMEKIAQSVRYKLAGTGFDAEGKFRVVVVKRFDS